MNKKSLYNNAKEIFLSNYVWQQNLFNQHFKVTLIYFKEHQLAVCFSKIKVLY